MDNAILTPSLIWKDFQTEGDLKPSIIRQYEEDGVLFREVYFNAKKTEDGVVRVYAIFACPAREGTYPAILYCHDFGSCIDLTAQREMADCGYASLCFDYAGEREGVNRYTIYPKSVDYANYARAGRRLAYVDTVATETSLYVWTCVAKFAAKFLSTIQEVDEHRIAVIGMRRGGYLAWQLASFCPQIKAACAFFEGGWTEYKNKFKYGVSVEQDMSDNERERWLAGIATQVYAPHVKVPFLYLGASNDRLGNMDRVADTLVRLNEDTSFASFAPRLDNMVTKRSVVTLKLFLELYLQGGEKAFPKKPTLIFLERGGELFVRFQADDSEPVKKVFLYYAIGQPDARIRNWSDITDVVREENYRLGSIKEYDSNELVFAYGGVEYESGIFLSTNIAMLRPSDIGTARHAVTHENMLYNAAMGTDSFTVIKAECIASENEVCIADESVLLKEGAFGIRGVTPVNNCLATYKIGDIRYRGGAHNILKFDVYARKAACLTVCVCEEYCLKQEKRYRSTVNLIGGELWQKVELTLTDFKTDECIALKEWKNISILYFDCKEEYLLNNMLWL